MIVLDSLYYRLYTLIDIMGRTRYLNVKFEPINVSLRWSLLEGLDQINLAIFRSHVNPISRFNSQEISYLVSFVQKSPSFIAPFS